MFQGLRKFLERRALSSRGRCLAEFPSSGHGEILDVYFNDVCFECEQGPAARVAEGSWKWQLSDEILVSIHPPEPVSDPIGYKTLGFHGDCAKGDGGRYDS